MALIYGYPLFRAFDDAGAPLVGGLLNTYIAGTTTRKATYADAGETTPNANPVVLDSRGECVIFFLQDEAYKLVLTDADGVVIWTQDNVGASLLTSTFGVEHNIATGAHVFPGTRAAGDIIYDTGTAIARLAKGVNGQILQIGASAPAWAYDSGARNSISGLVVSRSSDTHLAVSAGRAMVDDNTNVREWALASAITVAHGQSGGALTMVYVYIDPDAASGGTWPALAAANFVVSTTAPVWSHTKGGLYHPTAGSTDQRCVGAWRIGATNAAIADIAEDGITTYLAGMDGVVIAAAQTGGPNSHALTGYVPAVANYCEALLTAQLVFNTNSATFYFAIYNATATNGMRLGYTPTTNSVPNPIIWAPIRLNSAAPTVNFKVGAALSNYDLMVHGWRLKR